MSDIEVRAVESVERGCGGRIAGGAYGVTRTGPNGLPLEAFLYCHPVRLDPSLGVSAQGQTFIEIEVHGRPVGIVYDWVGATYYPNVADFLEEGRRHGFSWRLNMDVAERASRMAENWVIPVHPRGLIVNWQFYQPRRWDCPRAISRRGKIHPLYEPEEYGAWLDAFKESHFGEDLENHMCSGLWWEDVEGGHESYGDEPGVVQRTIGSTTYYAMCQPEPNKGAYEPACIARLPLHGIEIVAGAPESEERYKRLTKDKRNAIPVEMVVEMEVD